MALVNPGLKGGTTREVTVLSGVVDLCMEIISLALVSSIISRSVHSVRNMEHLDWVTATHLARVTTVCSSTTQAPVQEGPALRSRRGRPRFGHLYTTNYRVPFTQAGKKLAKHDPFPFDILCDFESVI